MIEPVSSRKIIITIAFLLLTIGSTTVFAFAMFLPRFSSNLSETTDITVSIPTTDPSVAAPEKKEVSPFAQSDKLIVPESYTLNNNYHIFQTFNNCGPAALSMQLSYFDVNKTQQELGSILRPYQHPWGDNDDKSTSLEEMATLAEEYGFVAYHRPLGNMDLIKKFISNDIPVVTRTWLKYDEDIGHFRVVKGYNDRTRELLQDDSLQGKNLTYSYDDFNAVWDKFNFEYLVIVPKEKRELAEEILGEDLDVNVVWAKAVTKSTADVKAAPSDIYARFNLSVALYYTKDYAGSVKAYEAVQTLLPKRTLWYQLEPLYAYFELGNYQKIFDVSDQILNNGNRAYTELYILRGDIYMKQGNKELAKQEYEKAVFYNKNFKPAQEALASALE